MNAGSCIASGINGKDHNRPCPLQSAFGEDARLLMLGMAARA